MGLGVGFVLAKTGLNSFLRPTLSARDVAQGFHDFLRGEPILGEVALLREKSAAEFGISVLPIEEDIEITQDGRRVVLAGRTSAAGPGFHAYLIGKIKEFARLRKITIKENEEWADETEYFSHNDYSKLQDAMRSHLEQLSQMVLEKASGDGEIANIALSMPLDGIPVGFENSVLTQRGPRDGTFFAGPIEPALYFPWWQQGINPDSAYSLAEALLWTTFPWRRSVNEQEQAVEQLISELLEIARPSLASQIDASLVGNFEVARRSTDAPHPEGIGYLRHPCRQRVTGSWSVKVPGYFLKEFDPSDGLSRFWIGKRDIQISTYRLEGRVDPFNGDETAIVKEVDGILFKANVGPFDAGDWQGHRLWGAAIGDGGFAKITVIYGDLDDEGWARDTFFSLQRAETLAQ